MSCWRGRRSRPASRSSPCRRSRRPSRQRGSCAGRSAWRLPAAPTRRPAPAARAARARRRTSSLSGSRSRPPPASPSCTGRRAPRARSARCSSTAASAARARPRVASAGARRGGTRPRRCGGRSDRSVRSTGLFSFARRPHSCCGSPPTTRPSSAARSLTQLAPSRWVASTSGRLLVKRSSPSSAGTWLKTVCVCHGAALSREVCETVAIVKSSRVGDAGAPWPRADVSRRRTGRVRARGTC